MDQNLMDAAQANIAVKYDPQQAALNRQLELSQKNTASNEASINAYGDKGRAIIGDTFNTLYGLLGANKTDTQNALNQQLALTNQGYDQAIQNIQGYQQASRDYISQMAAALGQSGQGLMSSVNLEDSVGRQLGYANAARTNYGSTLSDWISKMGSLADMGIANAHQSEARDRSTFETELLSQLGANKLAGTTQETDVINKIADLMNVRQSDLIDMYNQLTAAQWERDFQQAQLNEKAQEASADLSYKYASLASSEREGAANRAATASAASQLTPYQQWEMARGDRQDAAAATQQALQNQQWQMEYNAKNSPTPWGNPGDVQDLVNQGQLTPGNQEQYGIYYRQGLPGLTQYNTGMSQLQSILKGLNTSGGGGGRSVPSLRDIGNWWTDRGKDVVRAGNAIQLWDWPVNG